MSVLTNQPIMFASLFRKKRVNEVVSAPNPIDVRAKKGR